MKEPSLLRIESALKPLAGAMDLLHDKDDWPDLYDHDVLSHNVFKHLHDLATDTA